MLHCNQEPVPNDTVPIFRLVIDDLHERARAGRQEYGTYLQAHNGRDSLLDAYEEALDLCLYLRQALIEKEGEGNGANR